MKPNWKQFQSQTKKSPSFAPLQTLRGQTVKKNPNQWRCPHCSLLNSKTTYQCQTCKKYFPTAASHVTAFRQAVQTGDIDLIKSALMNIKNFSELLLSDINRNGFAIYLYLQAHAAKMPKNGKSVLRKISKLGEFNVCHLHSPSLPRMSALGLCITHNSVRSLHMVLSLLNNRGALLLALKEFCIEDRGQARFTPLGKALQQNSSDLVFYLVLRGVDLFHQSCMKRGLSYTPLNQSAALNLVEFMRRRPERVKVVNILLCARKNGHPLWSALAIDNLKDIFRTAQLAHSVD